MTCARTALGRAGRGRRGTFCNDGVVPDSVTFQPGSARPATIVAAVLAVGAVGLMAADDLGSALHYGPVFVVVAVLVWAFYGRPAVVVSDGGVELRNVLRTVELPWPSIQNIDTKYALTLYTAYGVYSAWAAPAPSRTAAVNATRGAMHSQPESAFALGGLRPGDLPGTASGDASGYVRRRWQELRDAGHLDDPRLERTAPRVRWHAWQAVVVATLTALAVVALRTA